MSRNDERKQPSDRRTLHNHTQVLADNLQHNPPAGGSKRQPQSNLSRSPRHRVRNHGVDSRRRQAQQQRSKHRKHSRRNSPKIKVAFDVLGKCSHVVKRQHRIELPQSTTRFRGEGGFTTAARLQMNLALHRWNISVGIINCRLRGLAEGVVHRVARHADNLEVSRARLYAAPHRIRAVQVPPHKFLIHDRLRRRHPVLHLGEISPLNKRNAHHLQVSRRDRVGNSSILPRFCAHAPLYRKSSRRNSMQIQRNIRGDRRPLHVRQRSQPFQQPRRKFALRRVAGIPSTQIVGRQQNALGPESRIRLAPRTKILQEQRRRNQHHRRKSDFRSHQDFAPTAARRRVGTPAKSFLRIQLCQMHRRRHTENQTAHRTE